MRRREFLQKTLVGAAGLAATINNPALFSSAMAMPNENAVFVDGLSFIPADLSDIKASKLDGFIADISKWEEVTESDGSKTYRRTYNACINSIKNAYDIATNPENNLQLAFSGSDILAAKQAGKTAIFFQIQGADCIEEDPAQLTDFTDLGLHILQLTHMRGNRYAGGCLDLVETGLTNDGVALIADMNEKNVIVDVSHSTPQTALEAVFHSTKPIIQSHGAARAIVNHARCSPDNVIKAIANSGGIFGVFMMSFWLTLEDDPKPEHFLNNIRHVANVGGIDSVAFANDFAMKGQKKLLKLNNNNAEGVKEYLDWWNSQAELGILGFDHTPKHVVIPELNNINRVELIYDLLKTGGFSSYERDKIMGLNLARVL